MWGCSVESPEGYRVAQSVGASRKYPLLCVVVLRENRMTIVARIEGGCSPELLLKRLRQVLGDNEIYLIRARADRSAQFCFRLVHIFYSIIESN